MSASATTIKLPARCSTTSGLMCSLLRCEVPASGSATNCARATTTRLPARYSTAAEITCSLLHCAGPASGGTTNCVTPLSTQAPAPPVDCLPAVRTTSNPVWELEVIALLQAKICTCWSFRYVARSRVYCKQAHCSSIIAVKTPQQHALNGYWS